MTDSSVQVPQQPTKQLDTTTVSTTAGEVHRQSVSIGSHDSVDRVALVADALKVHVVNGDDAGVVALDAATLAALETVSIANFPATQPVSATALPLPTGAATAAKQLPDGHNVTITNQGLTDAQLRATAVPVSVASLPLPSGAATSAKQLPDGHNVTVSNQLAQGLTDSQLRASAVPVSASALPLPSGAATAANQLPNNHLVTVSNQITGFATQTTLAAVDEKLGNTLLVQEQAITTATLSNVAASLVSTTILAANTGRKGATVYNDTAGTLRLAFAATASATSFTVAIAAAGYYELPVRYTGVISGIFATATGAARVTEVV